MENLFSGSLISLSWLISYTRDISILICMIFFIKFIAGKRLPAWWSYSLWLILLVRMLIPWRIENRFNISNLLNVEIDADFMRLMLMGKETGTIDLTPTASPTSAWWQGLDLSLDQTLLLLWLAGAIVFGIYILMKNTRFWVVIKHMAVLKEKRILDLLTECRDRLGIHRSIDVIITDKVKSPALFGYFHPRLLLPEGMLEDFSDEEMTYVFMHELGHLKRHDIAVSCLITLFQVIHWFNPLVWFAFYQMRIDQESACDSSVLSRLQKHQSIEYASVIVGFLERYCQNRQLPCMAGILENKTQMKRRLTMIINYKKLSTAMTVLASTLLVTTGLFFFALTGFAETQGQAELDQAAQKVLKEAQEAIEQNNFDSAEKILSAYFDSNPASRPDILYYTLGMVYYNLGRLDDAENIYELGHDAYPDSEQMLANYAFCSYENQEYIQAGSLFEKLSEMSPENKTDYLERAALCYYTDNDFYEAKRVLEKINELSNGTNTKIIKQLYEISNYLGQTNESQKYLSQLSSAEPEKEDSGSGITEGTTPTRSANGSTRTPMTGISSRTQSEVAGMAPEVGNRQSVDSDSPDNAYGLSEVDTPPRVLSAVPPQYPFLAKAENIEGTLTVQFIVTEEGAVRDVKVTESEPEGVFDEAAVAAIEQYIFEPATKDGEAVDCIVHAPMAFQLK